MGNEEITKKVSGVSWIILLFLGIFLHNAFTFINTEGNTHPLVGSLFNMILALFIFILIFHKDEIKREKLYIVNQAYQTCLDNYFKIFKKQNK